jgi:hypothetical protein
MDSMFPHSSVIIEVSSCIFLAILLIWFFYFMLGASTHETIKVIGREFRGILRISEVGSINAITILVLGVVLIEEISWGGIRKLSEAMRDQVSASFEITIFSVFFAIVGLLSSRVCR